MNVLNTKNIPAVTMLRGIACLMVCFRHFTGTTDAISLIEFGKYGGYGVPIFFAISGFIIPYSLFQSKYQLKNYPLFLFKRICRLEPPYLISIVGIFLLSAVAQLSPFCSSSRIEIFNFNTLSHLFYFTDILGEKWLNSAFWTLAIEFQFYILIGLIYPLLTAKKFIFKVLFFCTFCVIPFVFNDDRFVLNFFLMFVSGISLFWLITKQINKTKFILFLAIILVLGYLKTGIAAPIYTLFTIGFILFVEKPWKPLIFLGTISYSLYLIHTPVGTDGIINFLQNYIVSSNGRIWLMYLSFPVVVFLAWVYYLLVEKPAKKFAKKIHYSSWVK